MTQDQFRDLLKSKGIEPVIPARKRRLNPASQDQDHSYVRQISFDGQCRTARRTQPAGGFSEPRGGRPSAILLSLSGWNSTAIGEVFGRRKLCDQRFRRVRQDTVRDRYSSFMREGLHARGLGRHRATPRARLFSGESAGGLPRRCTGAAAPAMARGVSPACRRSTIRARMFGVVLASL